MEEETWLLGCLQVSFDRAIPVGIGLLRRNSVVKDSLNQEVVRLLQLPRNSENNNGKKAAVDQGVLGQFSMDVRDRSVAPGRQYH